MSRTALFYLLAYPIKIGWGYEFVRKARKDYTRNTLCGKVSSSSDNISSERIRNIRQQ